MVKGIRGWSADDSLMGAEIVNHDQREMVERELGGEREMQRERAIGKRGPGPRAVHAAASRGHVVICRLQFQRSQRF